LLIFKDTVATVPAAAGSGTAAAGSAATGPPTAGPTAAGSAATGPPTAGSAVAGRSLRPRRGGLALPATTGTVRLPISPVIHFGQLIERARLLSAVALVERRANLELELAAISAVAAERAGQEEEEEEEEEEDS